MRKNSGNDAYTKRLESELGRPIPEPTRSEIVGYECYAANYETFREDNVDLALSAINAPQDFHERWRSDLDTLLNHFAETTRADLWSELEVNVALPVEEVGFWLGERCAEQKRVGDRLVIRVPRHARVQDPPSKRGLHSVSEEDFNDATEVRRHILGSKDQHDVWAGKSLSVHKHDPYSDLASFGAPLYRLASAVLHLDRITGCGREQALLFALSDVRPSVPLIRANTARLGGADLHLGVLVDAQTLRAWYAGFRKSLSFWVDSKPTRRPRAKSEALWRMYLDDPKATSRQLFEQWRSEYPEGHEWHEGYSTAASMAETLRQMKKQRGGE